MHNHPHYTCDATGVTIRHIDPHKHAPRDYRQIPVQVAVHRDGTLEMHGEHFTAKAAMSVDQAIGLAMMILFTVRDQVATSVPVPKVTQ